MGAGTSGWNALALLWQGLCNLLYTPVHPGGEVGLKVFTPAADGGTGIKRC